MKEPTKANIIFQQLGGNKFVAMTGAKYFIFGENKLQFSIGRNASRTNRVVIVLDPDDTYTIKFIKYTPYSFKIRKDGSFKETPESEQTIEEYSGVYADLLQNVFTQVTGLYTRL